MGNDRYVLNVLKDLTNETSTNENEEEKTEISELREEAAMWRRCTQETYENITPNKDIPMNESIQESLNLYSPKKNVYKPRYLRIPDQDILYNKLWQQKPKIHPFDPTAYGRTVS